MAVETEQLLKVAVEAEQPLKVTEGQNLEAAGSGQSAGRWGSGYRELERSRQ